MKTLSPTTDNMRQYDLCALDGLRAITCEIKSREDSRVSDWWVTGPDSKKNLRVLARVNVPLVTTREATPSLASLMRAYEDFVRPLVDSSQKLGGMAQTLNPPEVAIKKHLCEAHLDIHKILGNLGMDGDDQKMNVVRQYQLIKSIGFKSAIPMIAAREGLKTTTVLRRIDTAKAQGLLPKQERPEHLRD